MSAPRAQNPPQSDTDQGEIVDPGASLRTVFVTRPANPGSLEAEKLGCICPVLDNAHGLGAWGSRGPDAVFWINMHCPVHSTSVP